MLQKRESNAYTRGIIKKRIGLQKNLFLKYLLSRLHNHCTSGKSQNRYTYVCINLIVLSSCNHAECLSPYIKFRAGVYPYSKHYSTYFEMSPQTKIVSLSLKPLLTGLIHARISTYESNFQNNIQRRLVK